VAAHFNDKVLHLPENISIMMASILAISLAVGRLVAGVVKKKKLDMGSQLLYRYNVSCGFVLPKTVGLDVKEITLLVIFH
jgi:hypothetical protein